MYSLQYQKILSIYNFFAKIDFTTVLYCRWDRNQGSEVDKQSSFWLEDEPNVNEFDYNIREFSPLTKEGIEECTSNPAFDCFVKGDGGGGEDPNFKCQTEGNAFFVPTNTIGDIDDFDEVMTSCPDGNCNIVPNDALFVSFDLVKATTNDADPACMAITSPNVKQAQQNEMYDKCSLTFDFEEDVERYFYAKWLDLKCNQRTRALMCTVTGNLLLRFVILMSSVIINHIKISYKLQIYI